MKNKVIGIYYKLRKGSRLNTFEVSELEDRFEQLAALRDRAMGNREMKRRGGWSDLIVIAEVDNRETMGEALFEEILGDMFPKLKEKLSSRFRSTTDSKQYNYNKIIYNTDISETEEYYEQKKVFKATQKENKTTHIIIIIIINKEINWQPTHRQQP